MEQEYKIELATENDAEGIARCFRDTYQDYPWPVFFDPEGVKQLMKSPGVTTFVVRDEEGIVQGTGSLVFDSKRDKAELGRTVLHPDFRGVRNAEWLSAYDMLTHHRIGYAKRNGARLVHTAAVSFHPRSQHGLLKSHMVPVGIQLVKYPDISGAGQRESTVVMAHCSSRWSPETLDVYVPDDGVAGVVNDTVGRVNSVAKRTMLKRSVLPYDARASEVSLHLDDIDAEVSRHAVYSMLPGDVPVYMALKGIFETAQRNGLLYVEVKLSASHPSMGDAYTALRESGFKFGGFLPEWLKNGQPHDALLLENVLTQEVDMAKVNVHKDAQHVVEYLTLYDDKNI